MALSMDIREKVMKAIAGGMSRRQAAARFDIGPATAVRWAKRVETSGDVAPMKMGGDRRSRRIEAHAKFILAQIEEQPDLMMWTASPQRHHSAKAWSQERHKEGDRP